MSLTFAVFSTEPFRTATAFVLRWIHSYITTTVTTITARLALTRTRGNCQKKQTTVSKTEFFPKKKVDFHYLLFSEAYGGEFFGCGLLFPGIKLTKIISRIVLSRIRIIDGRIFMYANLTKL